VQSDRVIESGLESPPLQLPLGIKNFTQPGSPQRPAAPLRKREVKPSRSNTPDIVSSLLEEFMGGGNHQDKTTSNQQSSRAMTNSSAGFNLN